MRDPSENSNSNSEHNREGFRRNRLRPQSPRVRVSTRNGPGLTRTFRYNNSNNNNVGNRPELTRSAIIRYSNSNTNNNNVGNVRPRVRPRVRQRIHNADELRRYTTGVARQLFGGNNEGPKSPPKAPKKVNVSKYEKMLKNLENKNKNKNTKNTKNTKNNKPNNENKNVASWFNNSMTEAKKSNIPKDKRVFLLTDMTNNGKIKQVWDRRFLNGLVESYENRYNRVREANDPFFTSPLTRKKFSKNDIKAYPPTNATKKRIKQIMNSKALIAEVNKIIKIKNRERNDPWAREDVHDPIKDLVRKGTITTKKQLQELNTIYQVCGREMFIVGHKRNGAYYKAYVDGKFKPHHMKFMKDAPTVISELYDPFITKTKASDTVPLYKLPSSATKYLSQFEKYVSGGHWYARPFIVRVLRQVVRDGYVNYLRKETFKEINIIKNAKLRNELSEYYNWHQTIQNAAS